MAEGAQKTASSKIIPYAADWTLKDLDGNDVTLSSFKGKKVLVSFGATWCPSCVEEVDDLKAFYEKYQDKDVKLISIDLQESANKVSNFVKKHDIKYTVLLDSDRKVASQYNVYGIPTVLLIDENGIINYHGQMPQGGLESLIK
jgi:peroxiredoxin